MIVRRRIKQKMWKYPKWIKDEEYVERAMEKFANHKARVSSIMSGCL